MHTKLFVILFFDKVRFILLFLFLVSASSYLIVKQIDGLMREPEAIEIPDIEIMSSQEEEYPDTDIIEESLDELVMELNEMADYDTEIYGMTARNLYTFSSPFYYVSFRIYGAEEHFFEQFKNRLVYGTIPCQGRKEVLVGNNAALFYELQVGDIINEKIELDADAEYGEYIVSGILEEKDKYFGNGFYIVKENFQNLNMIPEDNMIMIYVSGKRIYKEITSHIDNIKSKYKIGEYVDNYKEKIKEKNKPVKSIILTFMISFLLLELVYIYISKGMGKKAGIIKALGIPDSRVFIICALGFGVLIILASVIVFVLSLLLFDIKLHTLFFLLLTISIIIFLILFVEVAIMYKRIKPSASMPAK